MKRTHIILAILLILLATALRIVNQEMHWYNLAPLASLGLFSGAIIKDKRIAFSITLIAQFISDIYIALFTQYQGFYGVDQFFVYGGMVMVTLLGTGMGQPKALKVLGYSIAGSAIFFLVSNFGVWVKIEATGDIFGYGTGLKGLGTTFLMALPFYSKMGTTLFFNSFIGDIVGCSVLFGAYALLKQPLSTRLQKA
ncbi:MAG: hypothetical protein BGO69_04345 [Bacteroidetes bacterium 46-16]|nr:MAG: hypothetical protein BGO69_04345 [Bacteroidetes bacterium 46-16]